MTLLISSLGFTFATSIAAGHSVVGALIHTVIAFILGVILFALGAWWFVSSVVA